MGDLGHRLIPFRVASATLALNVSKWSQRGFQPMLLAPALRALSPPPRAAPSTYRPVQPSGATSVSQVRRWLTVTVDRCRMQRIAGAQRKSAMIHLFASARLEDPQHKAVADQICGES